MAYIVRLYPDPQSPAPFKIYSAVARQLSAEAPLAFELDAKFALSVGEKRLHIDAPLVLAGPINGQSFTAWVEQFLLPTLTPGDVVIMNDLGSHKGRAVRQLIRSVGTRLLFLPPYSPDLNPIEQVFAKLKTLLRKAAPRSIEATWKQIGSLLDAFDRPSNVPFLPAGSMPCDVPSRV